MFTPEEKDIRQPYIPWAIFDELRDEKNCRYGNVATWSRMRSRALDNFFGKDDMPEPTLTGLCREIDRSQFGDVLAYLKQKKIVSGTMPKLASLLHLVPKTHHIRLEAREELQSLQYTSLFGGGTSYISFTEALSKAIGELLERYVLLTPFFHRKNKITKRTFADKKIPQALLYQTPRFFEWQLTYVPNGLTNEILKKSQTRKAIMHCVKGESLSTKKKVSIPIQHIQWGPNYRQGAFGADTYMLSPKTTSGAGGGFTLTDATLSGLCELVERDGFLIYWLNRLAPRHIRIDKNNPGRFLPRFLDVYHSLSDRGYDIYFLDTTTDIHIPSIACLILSPLPNGHKSISMTGKCHPDTHRAIELSLLEHAWSLNSPITQAPISISNPAYVPFADRKIGRSERIKMWRSGQMTNEISFFISGKEISFEDWASEFPAAPANQNEALSYVLGEFARMENESGRAYEIFRYDVRHPILQELEYRVVKVVVPALMPLYLRESAACLDSVRLREVPKKLGYMPAPIDAYNPLPHPFP